VAKEGRKERAKPANIREYLNDASKVAAQIVETLSAKTSQKQLLDATELANYKAACEMLKTCRELYLRQQAIKKAQPPIQQVFSVGQAPNAITDELRQLAAALINTSSAPVKRLERPARDDD